MSSTKAALFFDTAADFRRWLEANHDRVRELWIGYYKKGSGRSGLTYAESVEEALCFGWIDSLGRSLDEVSHAVRFTPRRRGSNWTEANIRRAEQLIVEGRVHPAGLAAFQARKQK